MSVTRHTRAARWAGAVLVGLAPLPWLAVGAAASEGNGVAAEGSTGVATLKVHEPGTPSGTESGDLRVCAFNIEGFSFAGGQTGNLTIESTDSGPSYGPYAWGPATSSGYYASQSFNTPEDVAVTDGKYQATLTGKQGSGQLAASKVFTVVCQAEPSTSSSKPGSVTPTTTKPGSVTPTTTKPGSVTPTTTAPSVTPTTTSPGVITSSSSQPVTPTNTKTTSSQGVTVYPSRTTAPAVLPQTGSNFPTGGALALSLLLLGLGAVLIMGPGRLSALGQRRH